MDNSEKEKITKIANNTAFLYLRMLVSLFVKLFTARIVLKALGVEDFGIYSVVGGFIGLFAILSNSISGAISRFISYEIGTGNKDKLKRIFATSVNIQVMMMIIIIVAAELFGVWYINHKMVIPPERLHAANWCFQFSIVTFCASLMTAPYSSVIIGHENMRIFAYFGLLNDFFKLSIAYLISIAPWDRLVFYAFLLCLSQILIRMINIVYTKRHYEESKYHFIYDKEITKELLSFAGWGYIGVISGIIHQQGTTLLINLFYGPIVNAAQSIANQVSNAVRGFIGNFMTASRPQIVQSYAANDIGYMNRLIILSTRLSIYLYVLLATPIIINLEAILMLWLGQIPEHCIIFTRLTLVYLTVYTLSQSLSIGISATGKMKDYQLSVSLIRLLIIPISYIWLRFGGPAECVLWSAIIIDFIVLFIKLRLISKYIDFNVNSFINDALLKTASISTLAVLPCALLHQFSYDSTLFMLIEVLIDLVVICLVIYQLGCNKAEKSFIRQKIYHYCNFINK